MTERFRALRAEPHLGTDLLHLFTLSAFAVAQPVFDLLGRYPEFFVAHRVGLPEIVSLVILLLVAPPLLAGAAELSVWLLGLPRLRRQMHRLFVGVFATLVAFPIFAAIAAPQSPYMLVLPLATGLVFTAAYGRLRPVRLFVTVLSPVLIVLPVVFFLEPSVAGLALSEHSAEEGRPAPIAIKNPVPIVMVVLDELAISSLMGPDLLIDRSAFPNFAKLADESHWFRNATTVAESTTMAVPAILAGRVPAPENAPSTPDDEHNLFTWLAGNYRLNVYEYNTRLCPTALCELRHRCSFVRKMTDLVLDVGIVYAHVITPLSFANRLPPISRGWRNFAGGSDTKQGNRVERFRTFVASLKKSDEPVLNLIQLPFPHIPYVYLPTGGLYAHQDVKGLNLKTHWNADIMTRHQEWSDDRWAVEAAFQRYMFQLSYTDTLVGNLLRRMKETGLYDDALLIVTADHGVSFQPGKFRRLARETNYYDILPVPLFIKLPNQRKGFVSDRNVETTDILPTIAAVLDARTVAPLDGHSVLDTEAPARKEKQLWDFSGENRLVFPPQIPEKLKTIRRIRSLFAPPGTSDRWFKLGPYWHLIGRRPEEVGTVVSSGFAISFRRGDKFAVVAPGDEALLSHVVGTIESPGKPAPPHDVAVAVNGVIRGVGRTYAPKADRTFFSAFVPEASFQQGENRVEVFVIHTDGTDRITLLRGMKTQAQQHPAAGAETPVALVSYPLPHAPAKPGFERLPPAMAAARVQATSPKPISGPLNYPSPEDGY